MEPDDEKWLPVSGTDDNYWVSDQGAVRRLKDGKITGLKLTPDRHGYLQVGVGYRKPDSTKLKPYTKKVHRLVAEAFLGPRPQGLDTSHLNGNQLDNRAVNLKYETKKENSDRKLLHGTHLIGERASGALLKEEEVVEIRALKQQGQSYQQIADQYLLGKSTVVDIIKKRSWLHVADSPDLENNTQ